MANILLKLILTLFLYINIPFSIIFLTFSSLYRWIIGNIISKCEPGLGRMVVTMSSSPASDSMYKLPTCTLHVISSFEGKLNFEDVLMEFENNVVMARDENGRLLRPELRQYLTRRYGYSFWKDDPNFSIRNHIKISKLGGSNIVTPEIMSKHMTKEICRPYHPKRSPWELQVFYNYQESPQHTPGTALGLRIHHSLADGFSLLNMINDLCSIPPEKPSNSFQIPFITNVLQHIGLLLFGPYQVASALLDSNDKPVWKVDDSKMLRSYNFAVSPLIPLENVKEARRLTKASFQAVVLECFAGATRRFFKEAGYDIPKKIHCIIPLPMINHPGRRMRNHMTACFAMLPVGNPDPIQRLNQIENSLQEGRSMTKLLSNFYICKLGGLLPRCILKKIVKNEVTTAITSNFPGPDIPMLIRGHACRDIWFSGGMFRGSCGLGFTGLSSFGNMRFVLGMDEALITAQKLPASLLVDYFFEELQLLKSLSQV